MWAPICFTLANFGAHMFYRWPGSWGRRAAFTGRYAGGERPFEDVVLTKASLETARVGSDPTERRAPHGRALGDRRRTTSGYRGLIQ